MARQHRTNGSGRLRSANALRSEIADSPLVSSAAGEGRTTVTARRNILRPYATAGVAIVGASLIAVTPATAPLPASYAFAEVGLTAGSIFGDSLDPWTEVFNTTSANASTLFDNFSFSNGVLWQQLIANLSGYAQLVLDDPSNITQVTDALRQDWKAVDSAITLMNANPDTVSAIIKQTMDGTMIGGHTLMFSQVPGYLPADQADMIQPIINFLGSPWSAVVLGSLGPGLSPWIALMNSMIDGDGFNQTLANMYGAFFNGATLDLSFLAPMINGLGVFPEGMAVEHLDIAFGGLFSPGGEVYGTPLNLVDDADHVIGTVPTVGGSIFNSVGIVISGAPVVGTLTLDSHAIGPLGAWLGLNQVLASQLGWGTGWDGKTPHVPAIPPGSDVEFPTLPGSDFFGDYFPADAGLLEDVVPG